MCITVKENKQFSVVCSPVFRDYSFDGLLVIIQTNASWYFFDLITIENPFYHDLKFLTRITGCRIRTGGSSIRSSLQNSMRTSIYCRLMELDSLCLYLSITHIRCTISPALSFLTFSHSLSIYLSLSLSNSLSLYLILCLSISFSLPLFINYLRVFISIFTFIIFSFFVCLKFSFFRWIFSVLINNSNLNQQDNFVMDVRKDEGDPVSNEASDSDHDLLDTRRPSFHVPRGSRRLGRESRRVPCKTHRERERHY